MQMIENYQARDARQHDLIALFDHNGADRYSSAYLYRNRQIAQFG